MFSFHATKLFHTAEGGALTFKDKNLKPRIDLLKNFGIKNQEEVIMPGINGKMNELQAILGLINLNHINKEIQKRRLLLKTYKKCLKDIEGITFVDEIPGIKSSYQYFVIRINENIFGHSRDYVHQEFKKYNVFTRKYFYPLCSNYPCYKHLPSASPAKLPMANTVAQEVLSLPFYGGLYVEDIEHICSNLKKFPR